MKNHARWEHKTARIMRNSEIKKRKNIKTEDIGKNKHVTDIKTKNR